MKSKPILTIDDFAMRSCWECNGCHELLKEQAEKERLIKTRMGALK